MRQPAPGLLKLPWRPWLGVRRGAPAAGAAQSPACDRIFLAPAAGATSDGKYIGGVQNRLCQWPAGVHLEAGKSIRASTPGELPDRCSADAARRLEARCSHRGIQNPCPARAGTNQAFGRRLVVGASIQYAECAAIAQNEESEGRSPARNIPLQR